MCVCMSTYVVSECGMESSQGGLKVSTFILVRGHDSWTKLLARPPCSPHPRRAARPRTRSQSSGDQAGVTRSLSFLCVASTNTHSTTRSSLRGTSTQLRLPPSSLCSQTLTCAFSHERPSARLLRIASHPSLSFATPWPLALSAPPPFWACLSSLRQSGADTPPPSST